MHGDLYPGGGRLTTSPRAQCRAPATLVRCLPQKPGLEPLERFHQAGSKRRVIVAATRDDLELVLDAIVYASIRPSVLREERYRNWPFGEIAIPASPGKAVSDGASGLTARGLSTPVALDTENVEILLCAGPLARYTKRPSGVTAAAAPDPGASDLASTAARVPSAPMR